MEQQKTFEVKGATTDDAKDIAAIQRASWLATYPNEKFGITVDDVQKKMGDPDARTEKWRQMIKQEAANEQTFVIREGTQVVGFARATKFPERSHVDALYVLPQTIGTGAGGTLFSTALEWLGDESPVELEVTSYNDRAIKFYEKFGFKKVADGKPFPLTEGKSMPTQIMRREGKPGIDPQPFMPFIV